MPAQVNPKVFKISASAIRTFKTCPQKFRLAYREGLREAEEGETLRVGTNYHALHEVWGNAKRDGLDDEAAMGLVVEHLNERYKNAPASFDMQKWAVERQVLLTSFIAYQWRWSTDPVEFLCSELPFDLPLHNPLGLPLRTDEVMRVGKIDHIVKWNGSICVLERKSTVRDIEPGGDYWRKSQKDTQVSNYALALQDMRAGGLLPFNPDTQSFGNTLYCVWRRPTIKPAMLTQKETAEFIQSGMYCEQHFSVAVGGEPGDLMTAETCEVLVNHEHASVEMGKKGFAIRETVEMFGARLLQDMYANPDRYFQRKEIARTDAELKRFRGELYSIYQSMKAMCSSGHFYDNETACEEYGKCPYIGVCYGPGANAVCDGKTTPVGLKRIFVDLTKEGAALDAE